MIKENLKMKKIILNSSIMFIVLIIILNGCQKTSESKTQENKQAAKKSLSDIQATACNTAHEAGTCNTRLAEVGIVLKEDCCEVLGKCC